jgi:two-component system LytT family sensor kinase
MRMRRMARSERLRPRRQRATHGTRDLRCARGLRPDRDGAPTATLAVSDPPGAVLVVQPAVVAGLDPARDSRHSGNVRARRFAIVTTLAWSVITLASASEHLLYTQGRASLLEFGHSVLLQVPGWATWGLATAPIVRLSRRRPLTWPIRIHALAAHVAACLVTAAAFTVAYTAAVHAFPFRPGKGEALPREMWGYLVSWGPVLLMAYASLVCIGHALEYAERVRHEQAEKAALQTQLVEAQLGALRMQLQPHFLFNTLNGVAMLIRSGDPERAVEMVALLGEVLRGLLRTSSDLEAPLASELQLLRTYLEIEQIRFGDRLRVEWHIDGDVTSALVPPLILQPVVENALRHGLWPRTEGGLLTIAAHRTGAELELEVIDQGVGLAPGFDLDRSTGVGLANVRARLARMYGADAGLEVTSGAACGVRVRLRLPRRAAPPADGARPDA